MKRCCECKERKPLTSFGRDAGKSDGLNARCKVCHNKRCKAWSAAHPEQRRKLARDWCGRNRPTCRKKALEAHYRRSYGITVADKARWVAAQDHRCAICRRRLPLVVDHDHVTGTLRELLCQRCNRGLGQFEDDPGLLIEAAFYLERHRRKQCA